MVLEERVITGKVTEMGITSQFTHLILDPNPESEVPYMARTLFPVKIPMKLDSGLYGQTITYITERATNGTNHRVECHGGQVVFKTFVSNISEMS